MTTISTSSTPIGNGPFTVQNLGPDDLYVNAGTADSTVGTRIRSGEVASLGYSTNPYQAISIGSSDTRVLADAQGLFGLKPKTVAGHIAADVPLTSGAETTVMTTTSLEVGTWLIDACFTVLQTTVSTANIFEARPSGGSATYTFDGAASAETRIVSISAGDQVGQVTLRIRAVITVAGTISFTIKSDKTTSTCKATTPASSFGNATGYTAQKVA